MLLLRLSGCRHPLGAFSVAQTYCALNSLSHHRVFRFDFAVYQALFYFIRDFAVGVDVGLGVAG